MVLFYYCHTHYFQIEGVAYRGRVMVEVGMTLDQLPKTKTEKADPSRAIPFLHKDTNYQLCGAFFSASMKHPHHQPIEFEVSIGTYVEKLGSPAKLVHDGNHYYNMQWEEQPLIMVRQG